MDADHNRPPECLSSQLARTREELARLRGELEDLKASTSWRITSPLRAAVSMLRVRKARPLPTGVNRFEPGAGIAAPLLAPELPVSGSDQSCRLVDAAPFLGGLLPDVVIESFLDPSAAGSPSWHFGEEGRSPIALISGPTLARELAFDVPVWRMTVADGGGGPATGNPSLLLVDTDLQDMDPAWSRELMSSGGRILSILRDCEAKGVPIVVWLRCGPEDYQHLRQWLGFADRVYAVDVDILSRAQADVATDRLAVLGPRVQPRLHNPLRTDALTGLKVVDRATVLHDALDGIVAKNLQRGTEPEGATILLMDSYWNTPVSKVEAMGEGPGIVAGAVESADKLVLAKLADAELFTANTLRPAWRIRQEMLRAAAGGVAAVVEPSIAHAWPLARVAPFAASMEEFVAKARDPLELAFWRRQALDEVLELHGVKEALSTITTDLGLLAPCSTALMSCLLVTRRPGRLASALASFTRQSHPNCELIVVLHGFSTPLSLPATDGRRIQVIEAPVTMSLGDCLNLAASRARGDYWAKLDDDDLYASSYLERMQSLIEAADAEVAGMPLVFTRFESDGAVYCDLPKLALSYRTGEQWQRGEVCGATLAGSAAILRRVPFRTGRRQGVDTLFLDDCSRLGARIVVGDGFGYLCQRSSDTSQHTWEGDERGVRERGIRLQEDRLAAMGLS